MKLFEKFMVIFTRTLRSTFDVSDGFRLYFELDGVNVILYRISVFNDLAAIGDLIVI